MAAKGNSLLPSCKVKNGPNEGESLAPVAKRLSENLGKEVTFVADYNVTGEAATKAVENMKGRRRCSASEYPFPWRRRDQER